jgi:hypothetical protein
VLSLPRGKSFIQRRQNSTANAIWISATTRVPVEDLLPPPLLTGFRIGQLLWEVSDDWSRLIFGWGKLHRWHFSRRGVFAKKLFGDLNCDILGPPGDGKVIILDDSDEEKEALDKKMADTELVATFAAVNPVPTASAAADDALRGQKMIIMMFRGPIRRPMVATTMEVEMVRLRPPRRRPRCWGKHVSRTSMVLHSYFLSPLCKGVGMVM